MNLTHLNTHINSRYVGTALHFLTFPGPLPDLCHCQFYSRRHFKSASWQCNICPPQNVQGSDPRALPFVGLFMSSLSTYSFPLFSSDELGHGHYPFGPRGLWKDGLHFSGILLVSPVMTPVMAFSSLQVTNPGTVSTIALVCTIINILLFKPLLILGVCSLYQVVCN